MDTQDTIELKIRLGETDCRWASGQLSENEAANWRSKERQKLIDQIRERDHGFKAMPLAFYLANAKDGQKPSYISDGRMYCGVCNQPEGRGDWSNPSENGISDCHTPGCPNNLETTLPY